MRHHTFALLVLTTLTGCGGSSTFTAVDPEPTAPGTDLGQYGVDIMGFCKGFNAKTQGGDMVVPVVITVYSDRSFSFITEAPPVSALLKKAAGFRRKEARAEERE